MEYYEYRINVIDQDRRDVAIALLSDLGMSGFEETEDELIAISTGEISDIILNEVFQDLRLTYFKSVIKEENWNAIWESSFQPIAVWNEAKDEMFAYIRAHFHAPPEKALFDLIITPKMSFGTGHHATTYGMMCYMSKIDFTGCNVVDFGTGTGVLAILAEKMGAAKVLATDNDEWCIVSSGENISVNGCKQVELKQSDRFERLQNNDIILANINLNIIKSNLPVIREACHAETLVLLSGILVQDEKDIIESLHKFGMMESSIIKNEGWLIIAAKSCRHVAK